MTHDFTPEELALSKRVRAAKSRAYYEAHKAEVLTEPEPSILDLTRALSEPLPEKSDPRSGLGGGR